MRSTTIILLLWVTLSLASTLTSASASTFNPIQSFLSSKNSEIYTVGQKITLIVEVFSETHFSGSTRFTLPDIAGAVFYKPEERAVVSSRKIDGITYSVQRHEFAFYPQRPGTFQIPPFSVRYGIAGKPGAPPPNTPAQPHRLK